MRAAAGVCYNHVAMMDLLDQTTLNQRVVHELMPSAQKFVWIATANLKDMHVRYGGLGKYHSFLALLNDMAKRGVSIRMLHASEPSQSFHDSIQKYKYLQGDGIEIVLCPRVHMKLVIVDGRRAYLGSANITGAGLGEKSVRRRNFETGILTDDSATVTALAALFDAVWMGAHCRTCGRRSLCIAPLDTP